MTTKEKLAKYRLSKEDYKRLKNLFGSHPPKLALALASALWNEHCSYKSSRMHLKKFRFTTEKKVSAQDENAGIVDLGQGEKVAFKMESHNHPSHIIPYHGAATGVGGILRDVFAMNARPVLLANYLCFGLPGNGGQAARVDGVIRGIGGYGNCIGIPNITGQTEFSDSYKGNTLVNALALGLLEDRQMSAKARGVGNLLVYAGAPTGRDGIFGAAMASESFGKKEGPRPTVQIGDPFFGKQLMEATLKAMKKNLVVSCQDMGAAGLSCSSFEMAAKGELGLNLHLDKIPLRDNSMKPEDILLSESQERMLFICHPKKWTQLEALFQSYQLEVVRLGEVIKEKTISLYWKGQKILKTDPLVFTEKAPLLKRPYKLPEAAPRILLKKPHPLSDREIKRILLKVLSSPQGRSRSFIYEQYDKKVGAKTVKHCPYPIGVLKLPKSCRLLGVALGCRSHLMSKDTEQGALDSVFYPALQLSLRGFTPWAVTDCLNFGSPEKPDIMGQFVLSIESIASALKALDVPVVSGNVSFYNDSQHESITATPAIGMIGLQEKEMPLPESGFAKPGQYVYLISSRQVYLSENKTKDLYGALQPPLVTLFLNSIRKLSGENLFKSSRIVGKFGLLYTVARMVLENKVGFIFKKRFKTRLFGEWLYEVIVCMEKKNQKDFLKAFKALKPELIGETKVSKELQLENICWSFEELEKHYKKDWRDMSL